MHVHNHGPDEGAGVACPEHRDARGRLVGECLTANRTLSHPDHLGHVALREGSGVAQDLIMAGGGSYPEIARKLGALFLSGAEFGLRFAAWHPDLIRSALDWCDSEPEPGAGPLELRERAMQEDADKMLEGCG